jgi:hypothetical protein
MRPPPRTAAIAVCALLLGAIPARVGAAEPKQKAQQYPAHWSDAKFAVGAEYLGKTIPAEKESYFAGNYVVVEVAIEPTLRRDVRIRQEHFHLRVNGKNLLMAQNPAIVAGEMGHPERDNPKGVVASAGAGKADVVFGQPRRRERFPGDPQARVPARLPSGTGDSTAASEDPAQVAAAAIRSAALDDQDISYPVAGLLYFPWTKKAKDLRAIELVYDGPIGKFTLKLQ